jgi:signal transduction histidine kinase
VADEDKARIFERFDRGTRADDNRDDTGIGLGLSIVSAIARAHGGRVRVEDAEYGGAVFLLSLPIRGEEDSWPGS